MASALNSKGKDDKNKVQCVGCAAEVDKDHTGILCLGDHHICPTCARGFVNTVFEDPVKHIPLKCMLCKAAIVVETFERQLSLKEGQTFLLYNLQFDKQFLDANEIVASCPFCQYFEINTIDQGRLIFLCQKAGCKKSSCFWCKKLIKNKEESKTEEKIDISVNEFEKHMECAALAPAKQKWDQALSDAMVVPCPKCGVAGMKNNACTHMICPKCRTEWCYVCGLEGAKLDKRKGIANIFGHNLSWKTNAKRCPMWLDNIHEIDARWPKDDSDGCVTFLHRIRARKLLKQCIKELGPESFEAICKKYNVHETCGFDMKKVMSEEHVLIQCSKRK